MNKWFLYISFFLLSCISLFADYWQRIENLPAGYERNYYLDVFFLPSNPNYGWICGYDSKVLRTTDGGKTWFGSRVDRRPLHLESIHFATENVGYCSGVEGIFKSVDGGRTWTDVTSRSMGYLWGCYFVDTMVGVVVGEGCIDHKQKFWSTRDGGATWTLFETNEPRSGMTDAIIYDPEGLAFAVGSGKLYKSIDGGRTWEKFKDTEINDRDNRWHEEITRYNRSFLLPASGYSYAVGNACQGGEYGGGMYFSTDMGNTWNVVQTTTPMYGTYLLSDSVGWACGYYGLILHTKDAGQGWKLKNCGINKRHTDDIYFIDENNAWVVGDGVWKLSRDGNAFEPELLDFGTVCYPYELIDTVYYWNYSFDLSEVKFDIVDDRDDSFTMIYPQTNDYISIPPCGMIPVLVKYSPKVIGEKKARLRAQSPGKPSLYSEIIGAASTSSIVASADSLDFGEAYVNRIYEKKVFFKAQNPGEYVEYIKADVEKAGIVSSLNGKLPVNQAPTPVSFYIHSKDTGEISINYTVRMQPCSKDTTIKVKARVVSSIINAADTVLSVACPPKAKQTISIPFWNSGNHILTIDSIKTNNKESYLTGFSHTQLLPSSLEIGARAAFHITLPTTTKYPNDTIIVKIYNNDSTRYYNQYPAPMLDDTTKAPKNPYIIKVILQNDYAKLNLQRKDKEVFKVCVGDSAATKFTIENKSPANANYTFITKLKNCRYSTIDKIESKYSLAKHSSQDYVITLTPLDTGAFSAVLYFRSKDCDILDSLVFEGIAYNIDVVANPSRIELNKKTDRDEKVQIKVSSSGYGELVLDSIVSSNANKNMKLSYKYDKILVFRDSSSFNLDLTISSDEDGIYKDTLYFYFSGICTKTIALPLHIRSISSQIAINNTTNFKQIICEKRTEYSYINIINAGDENEIIDSILIDNPAFKLVDFNPPMTLVPGKEYNIKVSFTPIDTGTTTGNADIYTDKLKTAHKSVLLLGIYGVSTIAISKYTHKYDSVEYCSPIIYDTIKIKNNGNIPCEVQIITTGDKALEVDKEKVSIQPFGEEAFAFSITPNEISQNGNSRYTIEFKNLTCRNSALYAATIFKIHKDLAIDKESIVFDNLWANLSFKDSAKVKSLSNVPIEINSVELSGIGTNYITHKGLSKGDILKPNEQRTINFTISNMPELSSINAKLKIAYNSICDNIKAISLSGEVPEEVYYIKIKTEKYRVRPKDTFDINIICNETIPSYVPIDSIKFQLKMDRFLVSWRDMSYKNSKIEYRTDNDGLYFTLNKQMATRYLYDTNQVISIESLPILGVPDTTTISLIGTEIFSPKKVIPIIENGFLSIHDYCDPSAENNRLQYFVANAKISERANSVFIEYSSSENIEMHYQVSDAIGRIVEQGVLPASINGVKEISKDYPHSVYFIRVFYHNQMKAQKAVLIYNR